MPAVRLETMAKQHVDTTLEWLNDPELRTAIDSYCIPDRATHEEYWRRRLAAPDEESYAVVMDATHVGNCGILIDRLRCKAELWLYLGLPAARGAGVGGEAARKLLHRVFDELGLNRAAVRVVSTNARALQFWRSLGFVEEGRLREDAVVGDSIWLGLLQREWTRS